MMCHFHVFANVEIKIFKKKEEEITLTTHPIRLLPPSIIDQTFILFHFHTHLYSNAFASGRTCGFAFRLTSYTHVR